MIEIIRNLDRFMNKILEYITVSMLAVMSVVVFAQVLFRLIHASIPWSEELSKYLLIWCTFLGGALCVRKGAMIGLELIFAFTPRSWKLPVQILIQVLTIAFLLLLVVVGYQTAGRVWTQTTPVLKLSMGLMYAAVPTGALFMMINTIFVMIDSIFRKEEQR
ncbi:MAG: TRAP transporter small permease [Lachnospiraceae bacterium]